MNKLKEEALARIKDPKVREHYRAQFEMEEELEREGIRTGGIFETHGVPSSGFITGPVEEPIVAPEPQRSLGPGIWVAIFIFLVIAAIFWGTTR